MVSRHTPKQKKDNDKDKDNKTTGSSRNDEESDGESDAKKKSKKSKKSKDKEENEKATKHKVSAATGNMEPMTTNNSIVAYIITTSGKMFVNLFPPRRIAA